ncbi:peptide ABC transporter substrate-binding protein [Oceanibium sediminis]|uniref:peptide ABC transporter substrate-binding protein n=1 Tax=Oceanibium sediminis TaxID=2026339 RepID=UPI000DD2D5ED|nr:peptide ABC transporter substrate-binding protein [Oceanibium sediminis]
MLTRSILTLTATGLFLSTAAPLFAAGTHPVTGEPLADNQDFTYRLLDEFKTLDPQLNEETVGFHVIRDIFEGLMNQDENGQLVPGVATGYEASNGNKTYTFTLRQDAKWSNGDPVTAHDFVYGWQRAVNPETASPYGWYLELTSITNAAKILAGEAAPDTLGVRAVDDYTLEVTLEQPLPYFPAMTTYATLFPAHKATIEAHGAEWTRPENIVSNGAYKLTEHVVGEYHVREKSDTYWDADNVILEKVTGLVINDANQALTRYLAGEIDYMDDLPPGQFPALKADYPDEATSVPRLCSYYYAFNFTDSGNPALQDVNVRKALSMAIDRDVIVEQVLKGGQTGAYNFAHPATAGFTMPDIDYGTWTQAERDAKAKELMAEAGVDALKLKLIYNTSESHKQIATVVSQMWKQKLGVETELANFEWKTYLDIRGNQEFDVARSAWCGDYNEASTFLDLVTTTHGANDGKYSNARVDELMAESKTTDNPQPLYTEVEQILADEMAIAPIYHYANTFMLKDDIEGWPLNNVENNWYSKNHYRVATE